MKIDWTSSRKLSFPINAVLFNLCRLWPFRSKHIWIFGAREGTKFDDNSRYMYEYMEREHLDRVRPIWMSSVSAVVERLRQNGYEAYLNGSLRGKWLQLRAGVALYSHGLIDFGVFPLMGGAKIVALWHGMGFKKIYNGNYHGSALVAKRLLDHVFSWTYRDITPVTSEYARNWVTEMFTLKQNGIAITGQPRNDAFKSVNRQSVLRGIHVDSDRQVVIFMPTYRQAALGNKAMERIVKELYESKALDSYLKSTKSVFVAKLHPLTPHIELPNRDNFIILDYKAVEDNQILMAIADLLITDYSSCFVDYALLNRPIIFYTPDEKDFLTHSEQMANEYFELSQLCKASTTKELVDLLRHPNMDVVRKTNEIFEDKRIKNSCYSENVYNVIAKEIGL